VQDRVIINSMKFKIIIKTVLTGSVLLSYPLSAQNPSELNRTGAALGEEKKYDDALKSFNESADLYDKEQAVYLHNKGWALELQGKPDEALQTYMKAYNRNPRLVETVERIGYIHYKKGNYREAVEFGEKAAKLDPLNQNVKKWLPDAYRLNLEAAASSTRLRDYIIVKEPEPIDNKQSPFAEKPLDKPVEKKLADLAVPKKEDAAPVEKKPTFGGAFDFGLRYGYGTINGKYPFYISSPGKLLNIPLNLSFWVNPSENVLVESNIGNPYWGAGVPPIVGQQERAEVIFKFLAFSFGTGIWITHFDAKNVPIPGYNDMTDLKFGGIMKYKGDESDFSLTWYPRLLIRDTKKFSSGRTLDTAFFDLTYRYSADSTMSYYSKLTNYDFYLFNHTAVVSDYWGFFEITLGLSLNASTGTIVKNASFSIEYAKRYNLEDLDNTKPYGYFNGQGLFGLNFGKGGYFKGYRSTSNIIRIIASETIDTQLFIYQKLILEIVDRHEPNHEFLAQLGAGISL
jgi:hypothetical protein